jgi:hypothetical protein
VDPADPRSLEGALYSRVLNGPNLAELTLTRARSSGFDAEGAMVRAPAGREQLSVYRVLDQVNEGGRLVTRKVAAEGGRWSVSVRDRAPGSGLLDAPLRPRPAADVGDPTEEATFTTPASQRLYGEEVWSDLHWSDLEKDPAHRRAVVTVMKAIEDARGEFVGVARAGLLTEQLDEVSRLPVTDAADDPHHIFLADEQGRLITRVGGADRVEEQPDDSLRVAPAALPPEVAAALAHPGLREVSAEKRTVSGDATIGGRRPLHLPRPPADPGLARRHRGPEDFYLRDLARMRRACSACRCRDRAIRRGRAHLARGARSLAPGGGDDGRIQNFDFAPAERSPSRISRPCSSAWSWPRRHAGHGPYVPIDLVRLLYRTGGSRSGRRDRRRHAALHRHQGLHHPERAALAERARARARPIPRGHDRSHPLHARHDRQVHRRRDRWPSGTRRRPARTTPCAPARRCWPAGRRSGACSPHRNGRAGPRCTPGSASTATA